MRGYNILEMMAKRLSIIIINYGRSDLVVNFLNSICNSPDLNLFSEVIIVDNGYPQKGNSRDLIDSSSFPFEIQFVQNTESSYASGVNRGAAVARGEFIIIANNDVELLPDYSIQPLLDYLLRDPRVGIVGPQQIYPDGTWQRSYGYFPSLKEVIISVTMLDSIWNGIQALTFRHNRLAKRSKEVEYIDGAFMMVRRSCFEDLGGFNENYSFYSEDADFCWRAWKRKWKVVFVPKARIMHVRGASSTAHEIGDYTFWLIMAKKYFVKERCGVREVRWYLRLMRIALLERSMLYTLISKIDRSPVWERRAFQARVRYLVTRRIELC